MVFGLIPAYGVRNVLNCFGFSVDIELIHCHLLNRHHFLTEFIWHPSQFSFLKLLHFNRKQWSVKADPVVCSGQSLPSDALLYSLHSSNFLAAERKNSHSLFIYNLLKIGSFSLVNDRYRTPFHFVSFRNSKT